MKRMSFFECQSSVDLICVLRSLEQNFLNQSDEAIMTLRRMVHMEDTLSELRSNVSTRHELISKFVQNTFPLLILSLWNQLPECNLNEDEDF